MCLPQSIGQGNVGGRQSMTVSVTKLTPGEQAPVLRWPELFGVGIIHAKSKVKEVHYTEWQKLDFSTVDFKKNLERGMYDEGIAIRTGKTLSGMKYLAVLDFDGWEAVVAWFGTWENVIALSKKTLIEWHQDQGKIHVFLFSPEPILSRKIHIKNAYLEIRCQNEKGVGQLVFASPSIHKEGMPYCALGTDFIIEEMQPIDLLRIKSKISQLCEDYMSDLDKDKYDAMLDEPDRKLGVNGGRHDATLFKAKRYYFNYSGEWLDLTDEQRFERAWEWHLAHCDPPRSRKEFDNIRDWIVKNLRQKRDQLHESKRLKRNQARQQMQQTSNEDKVTEAIQEGIDEKGINVAMLEPEVPNKDYAEYVIQAAKKDVRCEDYLVRQIVYIGLSKDSTNPLNLLILAPTSEGKTHAVTKTLDYWPDSEVMYIGSMSPKVLIRMHGETVDENNEPIGRRERELKRRIAEVKTELRASHRLRIKKKQGGSKNVDKTGRPLIEVEESTELSSCSKIRRIGTGT